MAYKFNDPLVVAVTGGIGSGQTTVSSFFKKWKCKVINADIKAKEIINKDKKLQHLLKQTFGKEIFDKHSSLNTARLAELAFKDEINTQKLNQLVHPRMVAGLVEEMEQARFSGRYQIIIIDAALIYEISIEKLFDAVIVVSAPVPLRAERVFKRDGMSRKQFKLRQEKQIPLEEKVKWADFVIENDDTLETLEKRARTVYNKMVSMQRDQEKRKQIIKI
ncbi:MAG: dephospho-CoA kinase [Calditrichaceae bacterium]|nr:dephospho-CoA kinase [Calditrichaceae bacterium]MBN2710531.1 dephospho-CoA kinase [Calditrichaceae bacterium]RQV96555.1 MAG: dephospho-CoA kinase [Calditrichota bacterium]